MPRTLEAPELGNPSEPSSYQLTVLLEQRHGLSTPRDLAFNPLRPTELWVVNLDGSALIVHGATSTPEPERRRDVAADHFMPNPSSIAFGASQTSAQVGKPGTFATCPESVNGGNNFMGPVLWSSDLSIFAKLNPMGLGSHLDMLHKSPNCMGIAWEKNNVYWTFTGFDNSIIRYDFAGDHGIGQDDHSDGFAWRYALGQVKYQRGVPSHVQYDPASGHVYVADTGNARVIELDVSGASVSRTVPHFVDDGILYEMKDTRVREVIPASSNLVGRPSGLELRNGLLYVSDWATGRILAVRMDGSIVNYLETGLTASLAGMAFGPDDNLYFVDMKQHRVLRVDVTP